MPIQVPGCWEAQLPEPFGLVHAWYWRDLEIPADWPADGSLIARFGAVMYRCEVYVNARPVGSHEGGYTPFEVDLAAAPRGGSVRLALRVTNPMNAMTEYPALSDERLDRAERRRSRAPHPRASPRQADVVRQPERALAIGRVEWRRTASISGLRVEGDWATGRTACAHPIAGASMERDARPHRDGSGWPPRGRVRQFRRRVSWT